MNLLTGVYSGKRVLITGHTGFKGSWLSIWLKELGAEVVGYALPPYTERDNFIQTGLQDHIEDIRGDIRNNQSLEKVFNTYSPDFVFHLAAQALVREGYQHPKDTFDVNIGGTVNLLENCRKCPSVKAIIIITSDKCYENKEWTWGYRENDPMGGFDPYSASKGCAELVTSSYRQSFFNPNRENPFPALSSVRAGNVIGGGDWSKDRIIPDCIRALEKDEPILIRNPKATRPWQFVLEPLGGYLMLGARMLKEPQKFVGAWNFGPEYSSIIPVQKLINLILKHWGSGTWEIQGESPKQHEAQLLALDTSKARYILGWNSILGVDEAVQETLKWYKFQLANKSQKDLYKLCKDQIFNYIKKMEEKNENY